MEVELGHGGCVPPRTFLVMVGCKRVRRHQSGGWMAFRAIKIPRLCKFRAVETLRKINRGWSCVSFSFSLFISLSLPFWSSLSLVFCNRLCIYILQYTVLHFRLRVSHIHKLQSKYGSLKDFLLFYSEIWKRRFVLLLSEKLKVNRNNEMHFYSYWSNWNFHRKIIL